MPVIKRGSFTINIPENIEPSISIGEEKILVRQEKLLSSIKNNVRAMRRTLANTYPDVAGEGEIDENLVYRTALTSAYNYMNENLYQWVSTFCLGAIYQTVEFNYRPYIVKFMDALSKHLRDIMTFKIFGGEIIIKADFNKLGRVELWGKAVLAVRKKLGTENKDIEIRSRFWREKIYGTGREGVTVSRKYKGSKEHRGGGTKNITKRYSGKYERTIKERISKIPGNLAPFWYIIDKGNSNLGLPSDVGGEPYPQVAPTNFVFKLERFLMIQFNSAERRFRRMAEIWLNRKYEEAREKRKEIERREYELEKTTVTWRRYDDETASFQVEGEKEVHFRGSTKKVGEQQVSEIPEVKLRMEVYRRISSKGKFFEQTVFFDDVTGKIVKGNR